MNHFKSKYGPWALVAGASEGLGAAWAEALAQRGLNLVLLARRLERLEDLSQYLRNKYPVEIKYQSVDLADFVQVKNYFTQLEIDLGLLIYNAAYAPIGYFADMPEESLDKIVDVNIRAPLLLSRLMLTKMAEREKGGIILMSSLAGTQGSPKIATYAASKAFNTILAEGIWNELKDRGIDVIACCPGAIATPGYKNAQSAKDAPGTLPAHIVVEKTLNALGKGPILIPGFINKMARFFMGRILPRKSAISIMEKNTKDLS